ncbi:FLX-like protein 1 [Tanacetum coccineum]
MLLTTKSDFQKIYEAMKDLNGANFYEGIWQCISIQYSRLVLLLIAQRLCDPRRIRHGDCLAGSRRSAIEYEKKMQAKNHEHGQVVENNLLTMAWELEKLRAEMANAEKRVRATATNRECKFR